NNFNCPEDYGMADDWGTTKSDSSHGDTETVSDNMADIGGESVLYIKDFNKDTGNNILYKEYGYDESTYTINIQTEDGGQHHTKDPWNTDCVQSPDFFVEGADNDRLMKVWCEPGDGSTQTQDVKDVYETVQDYDTPEDDTYVDYDTSHSDSVCIDGGVNSSCSGGTTRCWSGDRTDETVYEVETKASEEQTTINSEAYYTVPNDPEYDIRSDSDSFTLYYWRDVPDGDHAINYKGCSTSSKPTGCTINTGGQETCSYTSKTYYTSTTKNYAKNYETNTVTVQMERITTPWPESQVFNTNDAETGKNARHVLFDTDYSRPINHNSYGGEGYYQVEKTRDSKEMGNDIAVSSSRFTLDIDMGTHEFKSKRDYFKTWDADGSHGQGDGFISILYPRGYIAGNKRTTGWTNEFLQREVSTGDTAASFVTNPQDDAGDGHYQFTIPSCPAPFITCLSAVDVSLDNLDKWGNPTSPSTGLNWQFVTKDTNRSLGTCEMYQALDPQNQLQSNYDSDVSGTTSAGERCVGDT
ncbi:MAG: hypothetical protein SVS85_00940, partial [Candidatus Nanohaloarchaea archaeon]|nr:hypothetical protein [Candidatus Nanohaloarchaea archaeon]